MTTPARLTRPDLIQDLTVTVNGPHANDAYSGLDPYACEPRMWNVDSNRPLTQAPEIAIGTQQVWHRSERVDEHTFRLLISGPQASGGVAVPLGYHRTWVRVTEGGVQLVRPAGRLRVQASRL